MCAGVCVCGGGGNSKEVKLFVRVSFLHVCKMVHRYNVATTIATVYTMAILSKHI